MNCLYCGKGFWLASKVIDDPDFCNPAHRWKYRKRLETALGLIERAADLRPTGHPGFQSREQSLDSPCSPRACGPQRRTSAPPSPALRLHVTGEVLLVEPLLPQTEAAVEDDPPRTIPDARAERLSDLVRGLRADIEKRRQQALAAKATRVPAPVIEIKAAVSASA